MGSAGTAADYQHVVVWNKNMEFTYRDPLERQWMIVYSVLSPIHLIKCVLPASTDMEVHSVRWPVDD